jgi:hypothetical protein
MVPIGMIDPPLMLELCRLVGHANQYTDKAATTGLVGFIRNRLLFLSPESEQELLRECWTQLAASGAEPVHTDPTIHTDDGTRDSKALWLLNVPAEHEQRAMGGHHQSVGQHDSQV